MTTETILAVDGNSYTWYNYDEPIEILEPDDVNRAQEMLITIRQVLVNTGHTIGEVALNNASYSTFLTAVAGILNNVEYGLDEVNEVAKSIYYGESYRAIAGGLAHNKEQIWRWFQVINDFKPIITGEKGKWSYLLCSDGYPTIKGKRIVLRGDLIG